MPFLHFRRYILTRPGFVGILVEYMGGIHVMMKKTGDTRKQWGTAVVQWLRCCAPNGKVAGSIPAGVSGVFH